MLLSYSIDKIGLTDILTFLDVFPSSSASNTITCAATPEKCSDFCHLSSTSAPLAPPVFDAATLFRCSTLLYLSNKTSQDSKSFTRTSLSQTASLARIHIKWRCRIDGLITDTEARHRSWRTGERRSLRKMLNLRLNQRRKEDTLRWTFITKLRCVIVTIPCFLPTKS